MNIEAKKSFLYIFTYVDDVTILVDHDVAIMTILDLQQIAN